jgi:hypothetical protein
MDPAPIAFRFAQRVSLRRFAGFEAALGQAGHLDNQPVPVCVAPNGEFPKHALAGWRIEVGHEDTDQSLRPAPAVTKQERRCLWPLVIVVTAA